MGIVIMQAPWSPRRGYSRLCRSEEGLPGEVTSLLSHEGKRWHSESGHGAESPGSQGVPGLTPGDENGQAGPGTLHGAV